MEIAEAVKLHDELLAAKPEAARHDSDICPFCADKAAQSESATTRIPPASGGPDVSDQHEVPNEHGGRDTNTMSDNANTMSEETHKALLQKAVADATAATEKALATKTEEASTLAKTVETLESDAASLKADNDRLNKELDSAQVSLKSSQDEVASLKADIASKDEAAAKAEIASKRTEQVRNLGLFDETYVSEKASAWADVAEDDWAERVIEWQKLKPATAGTSTQDAASAMSGTTEGLTKEPDTDAASAGDTKTKPARRAVLGLT